MAHMQVHWYVYSMLGERKWDTLRQLLHRPHQRNHVIYPIYA